MIPQFLSPFLPHAPLPLTHRDIVAILLDSGASPLVHDATVKRTPLHAACKTRKGREGGVQKMESFMVAFVCFAVVLVRW